MENYITKNGIKYEPCGEPCSPMLEKSEQINYEIGRYGHRHLDFVKKHRRGTYTTLLPEELKASEAMGRAQTTNNIKASAEKIVLGEVRVI